MSKLLEPIKVGNLTLKNRIMFPPLTTGYEERDGSIGDRSLGFYKRLAKGGVAYVVIGDVAPVNTASPTPKLCDDRQIPTFERLAAALHEYDCKVALQLFHPEYDVPGVGKLIMESRMAAMAGQKAKEANDMVTFAAKMKESKEIADSAYAKLHHDMLHFVSEATVEQLDQIKKAIADSAIRASKANIDAIEVHGDRLLGSLCSKVLNHRTDNYGGTFENRIRYALEVVDIIKKSAPDLMIEYKLPIIMTNPDGSARGKGGLEPDEAIEFAKALEKAGVDMIQVAQANHTGNMGDTIPPMGTIDYNWTLGVCERVKAVVCIPVATVGRVISVENGEKILEEGKADIIGYGRSLLTDPDIANKVATNTPIRECLNCNKGCVDAISSRRYISCVLNAENGDEETIYIKPLITKKKVAVVGGGIAGLEVARVAAVRGHEVTVFEKDNALGGQVILAGMPPRKSEIMRGIAYYEKVLPSLNVTIKLNTVADVATLNQFDEIIVAIGAHNISLPIEGADRANVVNSWDVLANKVEVNGEVAVIGGGLVGTETAEFLANKGCHVSIIEMTDKIANGESATILPIIKADFKQHDVKEYVNTTVNAINDKGVVAKQNDEVITIKADYVVMAVGSKKNTFDESGIEKPIHYVGDCSGERTADIANAIRTAYKTANEL